MTNRTSVSKLVILWLLPTYYPGGCHEPLKKTDFADDVSREIVKVRLSLVGSS